MKYDQTLRVLQICNHYEAPFLDVTRQYAVLFRDKKAEVTTVFLRGAPSVEAEQTLNGSRVIFLNLDKSQVRGLKLKAIRKIRKLHQQQHFQLCIAHRYHPTKIATQVGSFPVLSVNHTFGLFTRWERRFYINRKQARLTLLNVSDAVRDQTRNAFPSWPPEKIRTFYNHVSVETLSASLLERQTARSALGLPEDAFIVANVGRLHKDKDQKTLLDAFAVALPSLPTSALLVIYGKGPLEAALKKQTCLLGINDKVIFGGFVDGMASHFRAFDIFTLTSDREPFGMVLLEAMVANVPIICSDRGGGPEVVGDTGLLFALGDSSELAQRLITLANLSASETNSIRIAQFERAAQNFSDQAATRAFDKELSRLELEWLPC